LLKVEAGRERHRDRDPSDEFSFIRRVWICPLLSPNLVEKGKGTEKRKKLLI